MKILNFAAALALALPGAAAAQSVVFSTDFNAGAPAQFSGVTTTVSVQGFSAVPDFSGSFLRNASTGNPAAKTTLTLTGLAPHTFVSLDFLLAVIDSWDGTSGGFAPDLLNVAVNGTTIFSHSFDNFVPSDQTYTRAPIAPRQDRFFAGGQAWPDAAYDMGAEPLFQSIAHTSSTLTVEWWASGAGWTGNTDESWAIENLTVSTNAIPEPQTYLLLLAGLGLLGFAARGKK